jgi:UDPglucose 6-dehydrogenase
VSAHALQGGVGVVGVGYVGLVTASCFADLGYDVVCRDIDPARVAALQGGEVPIYEPGVSELVERNRPRLHFTLEMADVFARSRIVFVCVDTPSMHSGDADLSRVHTVLSELPDLDERFVLVMKSTVPVGTGEKVRAELEARGLDNVGYVSNPEFLREGRAVADFLRPDRIVIGAFDEADGDAVAALYADLRAPIVRTDVPSAEMIKYASNCFLATKISFINEIANVCEEVGADVSVVAHGMGLDARIGTDFLRPGIGYGGSCLVGEETVLARIDGHVRLIALEELFRGYAGGEPGDARVDAPGLEVLCWAPGADAPRYAPVSVLTRRRVEGEVLEVVTKMGRRLTCTADHPFVVVDPEGVEDAQIRLARELSPADGLPVLQSGADAERDTGTLEVLAGLEAAGLAVGDVVLQTPPERVSSLRRTGVMRRAEADAIAVDLGAPLVGSADDDTDVPVDITLDDAFWRVVGLYLAVGSVTCDGQHQHIRWNFHPEGERRLVKEVAAYWRSLGVQPEVRPTSTSTIVEISSRILASALEFVLGLGRTSKEQRLPDAIWTAPRSAQLALLSGVARTTPSVDRTVPQGRLRVRSRELADGVVRLLGGLGVVPSIDYGDAEAHPDAFDITCAHCECARGPVAPDRVAHVERRPFSGDVYSLEVPEAHTFATTGGLVVHNCFPKDVRALKQLAGNSGYHFQLLTAVIEVNELQKRRVVNKLKAHLGSLRGKRIALLGLAFKADTDDMREATSLVLSSRLLAEGASVVAYDPVAMPRATQLLGGGVDLAKSTLDAVRGADAAVIVTEWGAFRQLASPAVRDAMAKPLIVDGRNLLDPRQAREAGFVYESVGRPAHEADRESSLIER